MPDPWTVETITVEKVAKTIDHSLLRPELTLDEVLAGCDLAAAYQVASVCCRPLDVGHCRDALEGSDVLVGTVVGFPHGSSTTAIKAAEAELALDDGAAELDMVLPIGWLRSKKDAYVQDDIAAVVAVAHDRDAIVKVILENAYLTDEEKVAGLPAGRAGRGRLRQDLDRVRAVGLDHGRPAADAGQRVASGSRSRRPGASAPSTC